MHDDSLVELHKLAPGWDPEATGLAFARLNESREKGEILTGIIYLEPKSRDLHDMIDTVDRPLNTLVETDLCPGMDAFRRRLTRSTGRWVGRFPVGVSTRNPPTRNLYRITL